MEDSDWDALASELVQQNYAFVASFSVILWDCLITFRQEVKYLWYCQSKVTKYLYWFCRYCAIGYFILCSISGIQWTPRIPIPRKDCRTWFLIDVASLGLLYTGSQIILIRKVFNLYGKATLLASGLFALQCIQVTATFIWSAHISGSLNFNPICNSFNFSKLSFVVLATATCVRCISWALIICKVWEFPPGFFKRCCRYLCTFEAHAKISWGICLAAILFNTSHPFANHRLAPVYIFTFAITVLSIGTCRYILWIEKDRYTGAKRTEPVDIDDFIIRTADKGKGKQRIVTGSLSAIRNLYLPRTPAEIPSPLSEPEALLIRTSKSQTGGHYLDTAVSNFPLHGVQSYTLSRNGSSMAATTATHSTNGTTDYSLRSSPDCPSRRAPTVRTSLGSGPSLSADAADSVGSIDSENHNDTVEETQSVSDIEIGSLHSSSSVNSEELRRFYNDTWNARPFVAGGP